MEKTVCEQKEILRHSLLATFVWGLITHGFCYFNQNYSHDSLLVFQNDIEHQISIGRFLHPLYFKIRGNFYPPTLVGVLALLFLGLAVFLVCSLLSVKDRWKICLISGIMTTNSAFALTNATYLHDADMYALSLLFAVLAVYVCDKGKKGYFLSIALYVLSLGLYQSYFQVAVFLFMILLFKGILNGNDSRVTIKNGIRALSSLLVGLILYYVALKVIIGSLHMELSTSYNGLSEVGKYGNVQNVLGMVLYTYKVVLLSFLFPLANNQIVIQVVNGILFLLSACLLVSIIKQKRIQKKELIVLLLLICVMPFGLNLVCFLSQGMEHYLMMYSFCFVYILALEILDLWLKCQDEKRDRRLTRVMKYLIPFLMSIVLFDSVIYANQIYLKKDLEADSTMAVMNRIVMRMEDTEGYSIGETPVAIVGSLKESKLSSDREGFDKLGTGVANNFSVTYYSTYEQYFDYIMGYPVHLLSADESAELAQTEAVEAMPCFPQKGSCQMLDGIMVVKLSE